MMVLSCLSLTTVPCSIRFGITISSLLLSGRALLISDRLDARDVDRRAIGLEQDAAGLHAGDPQLDAAFARAHAHFERFLSDRDVREYADPDAARALHVARQRTPRRLDLARGNALGLDRLQPVF